MEKSEFTIVPKLLGLVLNPKGEVAGVLDASGMLSPEMQEAITRSLTQVLAATQVEAARESLERMYLLPSRGSEDERQ